MKIGKYELKKQEIQQEVPQPSKLFFSEQTRADSSKFEQYQLRPYNPDALWQKKGDYTIYDEMREDEQICAVLTLKKFMILDSGWEIECEDENIKDFLKDNLMVYLDELFEKKLFNILSALDYGYSLTEKIFGYHDTAYGKKIILKKLRTRPPHTFEFEQDDLGNVIMVRQDTAKGEDIRIEPKKFIHYVYQKEFDNPYGKSELNTGIYRAWWSKSALIKFWNIYLERFASPTVVGTYPAAMAQLKDDLKTVLKNIQAKTSITIPEGVVLSLLEGGRSGESEYERAIQFYNTAIARKMLVPDLMGFSGNETGGGSYALGQEHFGIFYSIIDHTRKEIEILINREIISPLVVWNFGTKYDAKFCFRQVDEGKQAENLKIWLEAIKPGSVPITNNHVNTFLQRVDFPEITEKEFADMESKKEQEKLDMQKQMEKKDELQPEEEEEVEEPDEEVEPEKKEYVEFSRELTKYEKRVNFQEVDKRTKEIEKRYFADLAGLYRLSINALIDDIKRKKILEKKRFDLVNRLELKYHDKVLRMYKSMLKESLSYGKSTVDTPKKYSIVDTTLELADEDIIQWIETYAFYVSSMEAGFILGHVKPIIIEGIRNGDGITQIIKMCDVALKGYDITLGAPRIENIVRTVVSKAFNEGRAQQFASFGDEIVGYQYSAIMDGRTSDICISLDQKIFRPSELSLYNPPNHFQCRSLVVPIFKDDIENTSEELNYNAPNVTQEEGGFITLT